MKNAKGWIGLAVLFAIVGVPQLFWKPSRFGGIFLIALAAGCTGEWLMVRGREKYRACRVLARVGQVLFSLFVLSFALVQICIIGVHFEENDPAAAPKADYYLTLGALVNPDGQPSAALAARCDGEPRHPVRRTGRRRAAHRGGGYAGLHDGARRRPGAADSGGYIEYDHREYREREKAAAQRRGGRGHHE